MMRLAEVISSSSPIQSDLYLPCLIGIINPQDASRIISILSDRLPLDMYGLRHLKRAKKSILSDGKCCLELILCPQSNELDLADIRNLFDEIKIVNICRCKPQNRNEFKEWGESWPIIYRPTELSEERDRGITVEEHQIMESNLRLLTKLDPETNSLSDRDAIIVNPDGNKAIVSSDQVRLFLDKLPRYSSQSIMMNPLYASSPAFLCIEGVAACVRNELTPLSKDSLPDQQYVCTGLDLYLYYEPDMMSSMALVHSRIRRVIYLHPDPICGALGSTYSVHEMRALNHRFRVYSLLR